MIDKCPFCDEPLVELHIRKDREITSYSIVLYPAYNSYGYWCAKCQQMFERKTKTWFKPIQSCKESAKNE